MGSSNTVDTRDLENGGDRDPWTEHKSTPMVEELHNSKPAGGEWTWSSASITVTQHQQSAGNICTTSRANYWTEMVRKVDTNQHTACISQFESKAPSDHSQSQNQKLALVVQHYVKYHVSEQI